MRTHIQILAYIYVILGGLLALFGMGAALMAINFGATPRNGLIGLGVQLSLVSWLPGLTSVFAYRGLQKLRHWGRVLGIAVSAFWLLLGFWAPSIYGLIFLLLGIYGLIVLLWPGAAREFS